jgi:hypothetical protein
MEKEFIELNRIDTSSTAELTTFQVCVRKSLITGFERIDLNSLEMINMGYELKNLFQKQIIEDMSNPRHDERTDTPFAYKCIVCIHVGEDYFFVYENFGRIAESLGGVDE